jgi:hypothetical protein
MVRNRPLPAREETINWDIDRVDRFIKIFVLEVEQDMTLIYHPTSSHHDERHLAIGREEYGHLLQVYLRAWPEGRTQAIFVIEVDEEDPGEVYGGQDLAKFCDRLVSRLTQPGFTDALSLPVLKEIQEKEEEMSKTLIQETLEMKYDWERKLRLAGNPTERQNYSSEIERLNELIARYKKELQELKT